MIEKNKNVTLLGELGLNKKNPDYSFFIQATTTPHQSIYL